VLCSGQWGPGPDIGQRPYALIFRQRRQRSDRTGHGRPRLRRGTGPGCLIASQKSFAQLRGAARRRPGHLGLLSSSVGVCPDRSRRPAFFPIEISGPVAGGGLPGSGWPLSQKGGGFRKRGPLWGAPGGKPRCRDAGVELLGPARENCCQGRIVAAQLRLGQEHPSPGGIVRQQKLDRWRAGQPRPHLSAWPDQQASRRPGQCLKPARFQFLWELGQKGLGNQGTRPPRPQHNPGHGQTQGPGAQPPEFASSRGAMAAIRFRIQGLRGPKPAAASQQIASATSRGLMRRRPEARQLTVPVLCRFPAQGSSAFRSSHSHGVRCRYGIRWL